MREFSPRGKRVSLYILAAIFVVALLFPWFQGGIVGPRFPDVGPAPIVLPFRYAFSVNGTLQEAGDMDATTSPYWWVNSGGYLFLEAGRGRTVRGDLSPGSIWYQRYAKANPVDTDGGAHPQNIFRLLNRVRLGNAAQLVYFKIDANNLSDSPQRNSSNGLLLFSRYMDGNNLYYAGLRVDGRAVIKKKIGGVYHTMAYVPFIGGTYDRASAPNLLPSHTWIGLRMEVKNIEEGKVSVRLLADIGWKGRWAVIAEAVDDGAKYGVPHLQPGYGGIRTDFMDVTMDEYILIDLGP